MLRDLFFIPNKYQGQPPFAREQGSLLHQTIAPATVGARHAGDKAKRVPWYRLTDIKTCHIRSPFCREQCSLLHREIRATYKKAAAVAAAFCFEGRSPLIKPGRSDKAPEADRTDTQHQQGHQCHAILAEGRDTFEEGSIQNGALGTGNNRYTLTI